MTDTNRTVTTYTNDDIAASDKFAQYNTTVRILKKMHEKAPWLVTWLKVNIRDATHDDFYIPKSLEHAAKIIEIEIPEYMCNKLLSCNPMRERSTCSPLEPASYYYVGDDAYDIQCQPACYNLATKPTYSDETGQRAPDIPQLNYFNKQCKIINASMVSYLEKPFYRSNTQYEMRVNDMPTGFSRIPSDNPYSSGFTYKQNKTYCKYFDRHFINEKCSQTKFEYFVDCVFGMSLINTVRSSIRTITNNGVPFVLPDNLPKLPDKLENIYTLEGWRTNINADFVLPELIDTTPFKSDITVTTTETPKDKHTWRQHAESQLSAHEQFSSFTRLKMGLKDEHLSRKRREIPLLRTTPPPPPPSSSSKKNDASDDDNKNWQNDTEILIDSLLQKYNEYLSGVVDQLIVDNVTKNIVRSLSKLTINLMEKFTLQLTEMLITLTGSIGSRVLYGSIEGVVIRIITSSAIRLASDLTIMLSKLLVAAGSIIGWILVIGMVLDLIFVLWDPYGYNNLFPPNLPGDLMSNGEAALRQATKTGEAVYTFDNLIAQLLTEEEIIEAQLMSLIDRIVYLDALVVNSEGTRIDKGDPIKLNGGNKNDASVVQQKSMAKRVYWSTERFYQYNEKFMLRTKVNSILNYMGFGFLATSALTFFTNFKLLSVFFIILAVLVFAIARIHLTSDLLVDSQLFSHLLTSV